MPSSVGAPLQSRDYVPEGKCCDQLWKADGCTGERYRKGRERGDNVLRAPYLFIHSLVQETASEPDSLLGTVYTKTKKKCALRSKKGQIHAHNYSTDCVSEMRGGTLGTFYF